jgi:WD40 repeat protein
MIKKKWFLVFMLCCGCKLYSQQYYSQLKQSIIDKKPIKLKNCFYFALDSFKNNGDTYFDYLKFQFTNNKLLSVQYQKPDFIELNYLNQIDTTKIFIQKLPFHQNKNKKYNVSLKLRLYTKINVCDTLITQYLHTFYIKEINGVYSLSGSELNQFVNLLSYGDVFLEISRNITNKTSGYANNFYSHLKDLSNELYNKNILRIVYQTGVTVPEILAISNDGRYLAYSYNIGHINKGSQKIKIIDLKQKLEVRTLQGHEENITDIRFSSDNRFLISGGSIRGDVKLWDLSSNKSNIIAYVSVPRMDASNILSILAHKWDGIQKLAISDDNNLIAFCSKDSLYLLNQKEHSMQRKSVAGCNSICFNSDHSIIYQDIKSIYIGNSLEQTSSYNHKDTIQAFDINIRSKKYAFTDNKNIYIHSFNHEKLSQIKLKKIDKSVQQLFLLENEVIVLDNKKIKCFNLEREKFSFETQLIETLNHRKVVCDKKRKNLYIGSNYDNDVGIICYNMNNHTIFLDSKFNCGSFVPTITSHFIAKDNLFINLKSDITYSSANPSAQSISTFWDIENMTLYGTIKSLKGAPPKMFGRIISDYKDYLFIKAGFGFEIWDYKKKKFIDNIEPHIGICTSYLCDSLPLVAGAKDDRIIIYDLFAKRKKSEFKDTRMDEVTALFSNPAIPQLLTLHTPSDVYSLYLWDYFSDNKLKAKLFNQLGYVSLAAFNKKNNYLALAGGFSPQQVHFYDLTTYSLTGYIKEDFHEVMNMKFSDDGSLLAIVTGHKNKPIIKLYNFPELTEKYTLIGHEASIHSIFFTLNNRQLISSSNDGVNIKWDLKTGELLFKFMGNTPQDYLVITKDNYYKTSKNTTKFVAFRQGMDVFPFEQFDLKFNRPDLVQNIIQPTDTTLTSLYHEAYKKRLEKMNFEENMLSENWQTPTIEIKNYNEIFKNGYTTEFKEITIDLYAHNDVLELDRINIWINNVPIFGVKGINLRDKHISKYREKIKLVLSNGENKIQISALGKNGAESYKESFHIIYKPEKISKPNLFIFGIGASKYKNIPSLANTDNDIREFINLYKTKKKDLFSHIYIDTLMNQDVIRDSIISKKTWLHNTKVDDIVIIYYSGHGKIDKNKDYYLYTYDIAPKEISTNCIKYEDVESLLDAIPARRKVFLVNACHSGEYDENMKVFRLMKEIFPELRRGTGAMSIASSYADEYGLTGSRKYGNNSAFGFAIQKIFENNSRLTINEFKNLIETKVFELSRERQKPTFRNENLQVDFRIW